MTYTDGMDPSPVSTAPHAPPWEPCDHCQAPLAERQRYCVVCGMRRAHADDPAARYFVTSTRRARASEAPPPVAASSGSAARMRFAIVLALLPLVAAIGVAVGRGNGADQQLVDALKAQKAPVVNVMGGGGTASPDATSDTPSDTDTRTVKDDNPNDANGTVIARSRYGDARSLTDSRVTRAQIEESRRALDHIVNSKGREYVEQQRDLPDQIVIP